MTMIRTLASVPITDDEILDEFEFPFGNWIKETVDWANIHLDPVFEIIRAPFDAVLTVVVDWFFLGLPWWAIVLFIGMLGTGARNLKVGVTSALAIAFCGVLGNDFWDPTAKTIGMIATAVIICAAVGIPLGVLSGRVDAVWNIVRPVLDGMQVVHPFVYLLPVIFFFGIGTAPGVMVTMVFALPPIVRLTNLGIRQVPEDVVEAARAYGAPESRVLLDVQLPLARAAILTGLNQTLLMAVSMVGIIALMAAGGLGQMVFRGVQNLNIPLAASSGLALYLVAVVMDRISQPEGTQGGLFARATRGWLERRHPERLLEAVLAEGVPADAAQLVEVQDQGHMTAITGGERRAAGASIVAAVLAAASVSMPWSTRGGAISTFARAEDADLTEGLTGLSATGGSWFGWLLLTAALLVVAASANVVLGRASWPRPLGPEASVAGAATMLSLSVAFLVLQPSGFIEASDPGSGVWLAVASSTMALGAGLFRLQQAPYRPLRVTNTGVRWGSAAAVAVGGLLILGGAIGSWIYDERTESVMTPEIVAEIDRIRTEAVTPGEQAAAAAEIASLLRSDPEVRVTQGFDQNGPGLGLPVLLVGALATALGLMAALGPLPGRRKWRINTVAFGFAAGVAAISLAWTVSILRVAPSRYYSGAGTFAALLGAAMIGAAVSGGFSNYERRMEWGIIEEFDEDSATIDTTSRQEMLSARPEHAS